MLYKNTSYESRDCCISKFLSEGRTVILSGLLRLLIDTLTMKKQYHKELARVELQSNLFYKSIFHI